MKDEILVSVMVLAYNQEKFIRKALESIVMQKTSFSFEIVVHDDASTDKTADIIREFQSKYPKLIVTIFQKENQYSKGVSIAKEYIIPILKGKYIALCEGDDYWLSVNKLEEEVNFLENNPEYIAIGSNVVVVDENDNEYDDSELSEFTKWYTNMSDHDLTLEEIKVSKSFGQSCTRVYRNIWNELSKEDYDVYYKTYSMSGDQKLVILLFALGKIRCSSKKYGVYRRTYNTDSFNSRMSKINNKYQHYMQSIISRSEIANHFGLGIDWTEQINSTALGSIIEFIRYPNQENFLIMRNVLKLLPHGTRLILYLLRKICTKLNPFKS